jgi:SAM-dependent methyltransferase
MATLKSIVRAWNAALANGWRLMRAGEWNVLLYRVRMKWKEIDLGYVAVEDLGLSEETSLFHSNSGGPGLDSILKTLPISTSDEMLDLGCGKAGAILTMVKYPFARVDGVEISEMLIGVARKNLRRSNVGNSTIFHSDAAEFTRIDRYTYFYMYYPFPRIVTKSVLENMARSIERRRRRVTLIFYNSVDHDLILASGFRVEAEFNHLDTPHPAYVYSAGG